MIFSSDIYSEQALALIAAALFATGVFVESFDPQPRIRSAVELGLSYILIGVCLFSFGIFG